jgi:hypothetical protein
MSDHQHHYVPAVHTKGSDLRWERQLTAVPRYAFRCACGHVVWMGIEQASAEGLIFVVGRLA